MARDIMHRIVPIPNIAKYPPNNCETIPPAKTPMPIPRSLLVKNIEVAAPRCFSSVSLTKIVLNAGCMTP